MHLVQRNYEFYWANRPQSLFNYNTNPNSRRLTQNDVVCQTTLPATRCSLCRRCQSGSHSPSTSLVQTGGLSFDFGFAPACWQVSIVAGKTISSGSQGVEHGVQIFLLSSRRLLWQNQTHSGLATTRRVERLDPLLWSASSYTCISHITISVIRADLVVAALFLLSSLYIDLFTHWFEQNEFLAWRIPVNAVIHLVYLPCIWCR